MEIKIKICGMKDPDNIEEIASLGPDFLGFIFYEKSKRFAGEDFKVPNLGPNIQKAGIFADQPGEYLMEKADINMLDVLQLHGFETPEFCRDIKKELPETKIWKAFHIDQDFDFKKLAAYEYSADGFLFDTKGQGLGGTGQAFDWSLLKNYVIQKPLILAGGLGPDNVAEAKSVLSRLENFNPSEIIFDINSRAEVSPGIKSAEIVKKIIDTLRK